MSESVKVGQLIGDKQQRDAIHVAIAPVVANEKLPPGHHVGFVTSSTEIVGKCKSPIGIVDPFLRHQVDKGQRFFLFLYPNTVTSLRHEWTHPAFLPEQATAKIDVSESERWLREFADRADLGYQTVLNAGRDMIEYGDCYTQIDSESARGEWYSEGTPELFWKHFENVTGEKVPDDKKGKTLFSCSC
jgi:hypothetical protein